MVGYSKDLKKLLLAAGCTFVPQRRGDCEIWYSPISNTNFTVDANIKSRHTANAVLKQTDFQMHFDQQMILVVTLHL